MKKLLLLLLCLPTAVGLYAQQTPLYLDENASIDARVEDALQRITLEEKVAMIHAQSKFSTPGVPRLGIPEVWMSDGPHGVRPELLWDSWAHADWTNDASTAFPALTCLAASFDPDLALRYGVAVGAEARFRKKDILLGPGCNIYRTPLNGRNFEYLGEDPFLASTLVVPYILGVQTNGVAACVKHYALNNQENGRMFIDVQVSDRALFEIYLPAFKAAVQQGKVWSLMGAYNKYRGQHTTHHERLHKILKTDWAFDGVVVSDWGSAHDTREAASYGLDIEMGTWTNGLTTNIGSAYDNYYLAQPYLDLLKKGELPTASLDDKVRRVLRLSLRTNMNRARPHGSFASPEHAAVAREIAEQGIVLLKNEQALLPIAPGKYKTILVVGENATRKLTEGGGSSELKAKREVSPLEALQKVYGADHIVHTLGYASGPPSYDREIPSKLNLDSLRLKAVELAKTADLVLYIGGLNKNHRQDCEGEDRQSYEMPYNQNTLIDQLAAANPNLAVVVVSGNGIEMPWLGKAKALVQAWYMGSEAGTALANVLSGSVSPSGKLPFSIGKKLEDHPAHSFGPKAYPGDGVRVEYSADILIGYRWFESRKIKPQFAFGYGLSYASFQISAPTLARKAFAATDTILLSCTLRNTGSVPAAEVVQVYVGKEKSAVVRAPKELKAFAKVHLQPGEQKVVELRIPVQSLAFYNEKTAAFELEKGPYTLHIGNASDAIAHKLPLSVQ